MTDIEQQYILVSNIKKFLDDIQKEAERLSKKNNGRQYTVQFEHRKPVRQKSGYDIVLVARIRGKKNE